LKEAGMLKEQILISRSHWPMRYQLQASLFYNQQSVYSELLCSLVSLEVPGAVEHVSIFFTTAQISPTTANVFQFIVYLLALLPNIHTLTAMIRWNFRIITITETNLHLPTELSLFLFPSTF
jgi:hypothetical protein